MFLSCGAGWKPAAGWQPAWSAGKRGTLWVARSLPIELVYAVTGLSLQIAERFLDFAFGFGRGHNQREARRTAVVAVEVHRIFEAGDAVLRGHQRRCAADAVLPVQPGRLLAGLIGFPNGDHRIRRGVGIGEDGSAGAHQQRRPQRGSGAYEHLEAVLHLTDRLHDFFQVARAFLDGNDVGMLAQPNHRLYRYIDAGGLRPVVDDERDFGLVGHGAEVEHLRIGAVDQILVVMRRADHRRFIAHFGGAIGQQHGLAHALHAGAGDQQLLRRGVLGHLFPDDVLFIRHEHHALAGGAHHDVAGECGEVPLLHVVLDLGYVNVPVVIEWGGDWWENTL